MHQVIGADIHDKAKPNEATNLRPEQLGCWRSHADVWRRVVDEEIETALILEDDADWDVNIHEIFQELSVQMRKGELRKAAASDHEKRSAPYGKMLSPSHKCASISCTLSPHSL
jgi:GR25 family glycosyltransferase involved in LPS biosynthesis